MNMTDETLDPEAKRVRKIPSRPTFAIPEPFYEFLGESTKKGNFIFGCKLCGGGKTLSTYYRSRDNLKTHVKNTHPESSAAYDLWCSENSSKNGMRLYLICFHILHSVTLCVTVASTLYLDNSEDI